MAKQTIGKHVTVPHKKHPGIHAKTKQSKNKGADNYFKQNVGQGR